MRFTRGSSRDALDCHLPQKSARLVVRYYVSHKMQQFRQITALDDLAELCETFENLLSRDHRPFDGIESGHIGWFELFVAKDELLSELVSRPQPLYEMVASQPSDSPACSIRKFARSMIFTASPTSGTNICSSQLIEAAAQI